MLSVSVGRFYDHNMLYFTGGETIRFLRRKTGDSQKAFGKALNVGQSTVSSWENDKSRLQRKHEDALLKALSKHYSFSQQEIDEFFLEILGNAASEIAEKIAKARSRPAQTLERIKDVLQEDDIDVALRGHLGLMAHQLEGRMSTLQQDIQFLEILIQVSRKKE